MMTLANILHEQSTEFSLHIGEHFCVRDVGGSLVCYSSILVPLEVIIRCSGH